MRVIPVKLFNRWKTRNLVGDAQHVTVVRVRPGYMDKGYMATSRIDSGAPIFPPLIWKGNNHNCWQGLWTPTGSWLTLPNISSSKWTRSFSDKGVSSLTVLMDNLAFVENEGVAGVYHTIRRGFFSPLRGVPVASRPKLWDDTGWGDVLNGGYQIELWEGYGAGDEVVPLAEPDPVTHSCAPPNAAIDRTWTGIIEDCELESHPDHITITARDFGVMATDQRLMGWNKAREIRSPVTFGDYKRTMGETRLTGPFTVSSGLHAGHEWVSGGNADSSHVEWVEMPLPKGHYEEFSFAPRYDGQEAWLSIFVGPDGGTIDRAHPSGTGWLNVGAGAVPSGGPQFVRHWQTLSDQPRKWDIGHTLDLPKGSKIRLSFSRLTEDPPNQAPPPQYVTGMYNFSAYRFGTDPQHPPSGAPGVNALHWVLVEDVAEVVRMLFIWMGFKEWHVDDFGWSVVAPLQYGEDKFFIDVIDDILSQGNYVFFMGAPSDDDRSIGVPHFERQNVTLRPPANMLEVRDNDFLEAATVKVDMSNLPYEIRYRGEVSKDGATLWQDQVKRWMAVYHPPWSGGHYMKLGSNAADPFNVGRALDRVAGIRRHFTQTLGQGSTIGLQSNEECLFACVLAAIQYALGMYTGQFQIAGLPAFDLNQQCSVVDEADGLNSRLWVASIESDHTLGPKGTWKMTIGGSYIDTEDLSMIRDDYNTAYRGALGQREPARETDPAWWVKADGSGDVVLSGVSE